MILSEPTSERSLTMSRNTTAMLLVSAVITACLLPVTAESVDLYTSRAQWETTVQTLRMAEDFESETPGTYMTPYQTAAGMNVETPGMFIDLTVRDNGAVNNSREMLIQENGERSLFFFPVNHNQLAFGFDWATGGEAWVLKFLGQEYPLAANASGFIGLVDTDGQSYGFELTSSATNQDGLAIDNLAWSPALLVFRSRPEWEAFAGTAPFTEGFESDTPGSYQTPYFTGNGCDLQSMGVAIDLDVIDSGLVDGSRELHFSDHGRQLSLGFPDGEMQAAFGFEWATTQESWSLYARDEYIGLTGMSSGFVGIVDQTQSTTSFILTSSIVVQQGIHIDNLTYFQGIVPTVPTTWGAIKAKYK
jgi:hypothetical protein